MRTNLSLSPDLWFWPKVSLANESGCRLWTAMKDGDGYGRVKINQKTKLAHRVAWELATGDSLEPSQVVAHTCDEPSCIAIDGFGFYPVADILMVTRGHLFLTTNEGNTADRTVKGRSASGDRNGGRLHPERVPTGLRNGRHTKPERTVRGERHWDARLTADQVVAMRARYSLGDVSCAELSRQYGISKQSVRLIVSGKRWRHLL